MADSFRGPINAASRYCAVFGQPIRHSASPAMQNAGLAALGLNWRYLAFEVDPHHLRDAIAGAQRMHFMGLNLTVPHKLLALELVDHLDESARRWGAVNTIRFEGRDVNGSWQPLAQFPQKLPAEIRSHGFNTDADAIVRAIREDLRLELAGARVLVVGAGGAGQTAALRLACENLRELFLVNRTTSKAETIARRIQQEQPALAVHVGYPSGPVDLIVNATSLGLAESDPSPLAAAPGCVSRDVAVFDLIYRPALTPLLRAAKAAGCRTANGLGMLLYQGAKALELWTGQPAPVDSMRVALESEIYGTSPNAGRE